MTASQFQPSERPPHRSVVIVQPYVPRYRVPLFERLVEELRDLRIECSVAAPLPSGMQSARGDSVPNRPWHRRTSGRSFTIAGATFQHYGSTLRSLREYSAVIAPAAATCADSHLALIAKYKFGLRVGFWGHVAPYVKRGNSIDIALERMMLRKADRVFAYTDGGASFAVEQGVAPDRITTLNNTLDTTELMQAREELSEADVARFRADLQLGSGRVLAYLGGLDESKRIPFLADALDHLYVTAPEIRVVVAGQGVHAHYLDRAKQRGQVTMIGYADARTKALLGATADALLSPGRIGLVAIDSLILRLPIVTADGAAHAPELEYLPAGTWVHTTANSGTAFANFLTAREDLRKACDPATVTIPSIEDMVSRFKNGIVSLMST